MMELPLTRETVLFAAQAAYSVTVGALTVTVLVMVEETVD